MFLYWPVLLVATTAFILFIPAPVLYHRSREWWAYSNVRVSSLFSTRLICHSSDYSLQGYIPSNFGTFFWATCIARKHTSWGYVVHHCIREIWLIPSRTSNFSSVFMVEIGMTRLYATPTIRGFSGFSALYLASGEPFNVYGVTTIPEMHFPIWSTAESILSRFCFTCR